MKAYDIAIARLCYNTVNCLRKTIGTPMVEPWVYSAIFAKAALFDLHLGLKMARPRLTRLPLAISQKIFSDAFSLMKSFFLFWLKFNWSLFLKIQLTITQHWFR